MATVIDASIAIKWILVEAGSSAARALGATETLVAPDLFFIECANVLTMKVRRGLMSQADAEAGMQVIDGFPIRAVSARPHVRAALAIAAELKQTAYDSLYLAVALAERAAFVTADQAFARAALSHPVYGQSVRLLGS